MIGTDKSATLINAIANLEEEKALVLVRQRLDTGEDPLLIIEDCQEGMRQVGLRYERHEYYLAGLIMADEIFSQTMEILQPVIERQVSGQTSGRILLGTAQNDIHDLGKNIVNMLLRCNSFVVQDLGVDVSPDTFLDQVTTMQPHIVGISGLLTVSYESMRETIQLLRTNRYEEPIIIGGGQLSEEVCEYVGADYWSTDAVTGVEICQRLMSE
jgi:methanogenic corrinoid protein MtbC1